MILGVSFNPWCRLEHHLTDVRNILNLDGLDFVIIWEEEASSSSILTIDVPILAAPMFCDSVECNLPVIARGIRNIPSGLFKGKPSWEHSWELNHNSLCDFWLSQYCLWDRKRATLNCLIWSLLLVFPQFLHILNLQASKDWHSCNELKNPAFSWACKLQFASVHEQSFDKHLALHQYFSVLVTYWKLSTYLHFRKCIIH